MAKSPILFLSDSAPWPLTDGKRQRTWFLLEALADVYTIDFLFLGSGEQLKWLNESGIPVRNIYHIEQKGVSLYRFGFSSLMIFSPSWKARRKYLIESKQLISKIAPNDYRFVFSRYISPLLELPLPKGLPIVCDIDDVYFELWRSRISSGGSILNKLKLFFYYSSGYFKAIKLYKKISISLVVKESDKKYPGLEKAIVLPNIPFGYFLQKSKDKIRIPKRFPDNICFGFIGKLSYRPNFEGLEQFLISIWNPLQVEGFSGYLFVAGSGEMPDRLRNSLEASKNVILLGFVEDAREFWEQIDCLICPVNEGGGSNIKIAESFMYGKPVIANSFSKKSYEEFANQKFLSVANSQDEWKFILCQLDSHSKKYNNLIKEFAERRFDLYLWKDTMINSLNFN